MKVTLFKYHFNGINKEVVWLFSLPLENSMTHSKHSMNIILDDERNMRTIMLVFLGQAISWNHSHPQALVGITVIYSTSICSSSVQGVRNCSEPEVVLPSRCLSFPGTDRSVVRLLMGVLCWLWNHLKIRKDFRVGFISLTWDLIMS